MLKSVAGLVGMAVAGVVALSGGASAAVLFSENFNGYTNENTGLTSSQMGTGLTVKAGGVVPGWANSTANNSLNAIDRGNGDYAIMFFDSTVMYYATPLAVNDAGVSYTVSFQGSLANYNTASQVTAAGDYVEFLLRDSTGTVASYDYYPSLTTTAFLPGSFTYTGTGSGSLYLLITDGGAPDGRFGGAIDNVSISSGLNELTAVPEPASLVLVASGLVGAATLRRRRKVA